MWFVSAHVLENNNNYKKGNAWKPPEMTSLYVWTTLQVKKKVSWKKSWWFSGRKQQLQNCSVLLFFKRMYRMLMEWVMISSEEGNEDKERKGMLGGTGAHLLFLNVWGYNFTCDKRQEKNSISCEISLCEYRVMTVKNEAGNRFIGQKTVLWWVLRLLQCFNQHDSLDDPLNYTLSFMIHLTAHNLHKSDGQFGFEVNQDRTVFNSFSLIINSIFSLLPL